LQPAIALELCVLGAAFFGTFAALGGKRASEQARTWRTYNNNYRHYYRAGLPVGRPKPKLITSRRG